MKLQKVTHNQGDDPEITSTFVIKEGSEKDITPVAKRWASYTIPIWEGLTKIAEGIDSKKQWMTFSNGISKKDYWVRLEVIL